MNKDEKVRFEITEAAKKVFQKWGINKTTMEDIANEAGKGKSTLYYYFSSKEEIFNSIAITEINNIIFRAKKMIEGVSPSKEKLYKYLLTLINEIKKTVSIYPILNGDITRNNKMIERVMKHYNEMQELLISDILKKGISLGEFKNIVKYDLKKVTNVINELIHVIIFNILLENTDYEKIEIITGLLSEGI